MDLWSKNSWTGCIFFLFPLSTPLPQSVNLQVCRTTWCGAPLGAQRGITWPEVCRLLVTADLLDLLACSYRDR